MRSEPVAGVERHSPPPLTPATPRWAIIWGAIIGAIGLFDLYRNTKRDGSTLCSSIRWVFRTDTPEGRRLFEAALLAFQRHIFK